MGVRVSPCSMKDVERRARGKPTRAAGSPASPDPQLDSLLMNFARGGRGEEAGIASNRDAPRAARRRRRAAFSSGFVTVAVLLVSAAGVSSSSARADEYPSWQEVEAARASTAASAAASDRINTLLDQLQARANEAGERAITAGAAAGKANAAESAATSRTEALAAQLDIAGERASEGRDQLGRIAAQLYRAGAADMTRVFLSATPESSQRDESDTLLNHLGTASRVSEIAASLREKALEQQQLVNGLTAEAQRAQRERSKLADAAKSAQLAAEQAVATANAELETQRAAAETLYEQLALLRNSTAQIERSYRAGVAEAAAYAEQKAAAEKAAAEAANGSNLGGNGNSGGGNTGGSGSTPQPPVTGVIVDPAAARAYAAGAVAARGWGTEQYDCLVKLWNRESGWRADALNPWSGAYGIPQAYPGSKMSTAGADWRTNAATQINWGLGYISDRYSNPCGAWQHSEEKNWY